MSAVIPKRMLMDIIERFIADPNRGISILLFCEAAGVPKTTFTDIFKNKTLELSEIVQRRVSRAYTAWANGEIAVMENRDRSRFIEYRRVAKPKMVKDNRIVFNNGQLQLKIGVKNRADYSMPDLNGQLKGK